jgi:hypothetical protein
MGNHFHALLEVPRKDIWLQRFAGPQGELRLFDHLRTLYSKAFVALLRQDLDELRKRGLESLALAKIEAIRRNKMPGIQYSVKLRKPLLFHP